MTTLIEQALPKVRIQLIEAIDRLLEAGRRARKPKDVDPLYADMEQELRIGWNELAADLKKEWRNPAIKRTFEARRGPSKTQLDALYNRANKRADKRHAKALDRNAKKALERGGKSAMKDLQVGSGVTIRFDLEHPDAVRFLKKRGAKRVTDISKTTRTRIKNLVTRLAEEGKSYREIGNEIEGMVKSWSQRGTGAIASRGELIAVTEVGEAYEEGRRIVRDELQRHGLDVKKSWLTVGDDRVCEICEPAETEGWIKGNVAFINGLDGPLGHPGCRCDMMLTAS